MPPSRVRRSPRKRSARHPAHDRHALTVGGDINTIRAWLGHVSIDTTNVYAEVDLEKARMLAASSFSPSRALARRSIADAVLGQSLGVVEVHHREAGTPTPSVG
jgi:integrase/recombinase XerD